MYEDKDNPCSVTGETEIIYSKFVKCRQVENTRWRSFNQCVCLISKKWYESELI